MELVQWSRKMFPVCWIRLDTAVLWLSLHWMSGFVSSQIPGEPQLNAGKMAKEMLHIQKNHV